MSLLHARHGVFLCVLSALGAIASAQVRYEVTEIKVPNQNNVQLFGINDLGQVVGAVAQLPQGNFLPFVYSGGTVTMLGLPAGYASATPHGINKDGTIVGLAAGIFNGATDQRGFIYQNGQYHLLSVPSEATAINDAGHIAGGDFTGGAMYYDGSIHDLTPRGVATAINNHDQLAGEGGDQHAFFYDGTVHDLGVLTGDDTSQANGLNDGGTVVGFSNRNADNVQHAFTTVNGVMQPLGSLGGPNSLAEAINNSGIIVGESSTVGGNATHAFMYDGAMHDLNDLLTTPLDVPLNLATAINSEGQIVALSDNVSSPDVRGFLLTPVPEPAAISAVAGLAALLLRRRGRA